MHTIYSVTRKLLAPLVLVLSAGVALAGPTYHVTVDTSGFAESTGLIDFFYNVQGGGVVSEITLNNFSGNIGGEFAPRVGDVTGALPGTLVFAATEGDQELTQVANFGGAFSFDLAFGSDFATLPGGVSSLFSVAFFNDDFSAYLGAPGDLVQFNLMPMNGNAPGGIVVTVADPAATVVPEPSNLLLMMTGLGLVGFMVRRRKAQAA
jgi:hypothetical protein